MISEDYPCLCYHPRDTHRGIGVPIERQHCWWLGCICRGFVGDNLVYLEQKANETEHR